MNTSEHNTNTTAADNIVISVRDLCVDYRNGQYINRAVDHISFDIRKDEILVVLGASGSGKTSMLNAIGGMITPASGSVMWNGQNIATMNNRQKVMYRRNTVGFIFQRYNLIPTLTAKENVQVAASMVDNPLDIEAVFKDLGITEIMKSYPGQMSGGEQQRVCIARALVKKPQLLLCDEPTGALDTKNAENIVSLLQQIAREQHIPVVIITHNPSLTEKADHCLYISDGKIEKEEILYK